jgi:hypothetical protein
LTLSEYCGSLKVVLDFDVDFKELKIRPPASYTAQEYSIFTDDFVTMPPVHTVV